jgi:3',5'-cyclic AMP phosphodiesterase CpdA
MQLFESLVDKVKSLSPDVIFWTGDAAPHDQHLYSLEHVTKYNQLVTDYMTEHFKKSDGSQIPIYPIEGNHDFEVINSMRFDKANDSMVVELASQWEGFLTRDALETFKKFGYYKQ